MEMMQMMDMAEVERSIETAITSLMPAVVHGFWYGVACSSARTQADRMLLRHKGELETAMSEALLDQSENLSNWAHVVSLKKGRVDACLNHCGVSPRHFRPLWHRLRSVSLVACLCGIDINNAATQGEIILCLAEAEIKQVPAEILTKDAASIAAHLLVQRMDSSNSGALSLTCVQQFLSNTSEDMASRRRAAEYFRARHHELQGARLLQESAKVKSYTEQQAMREQARREFAIAGLPHRIQDVEKEMLRQQEQMQSYATVRWLLSVVFRVLYYLVSTTITIGHCSLVALIGASAKVFHFLDYRQYAASALTRSSSSAALPADVELGLG